MSKRRKPKFRVGQLVMTRDGKITKIAAIKDGVLYESAGSGSFFAGCITGLPDDLRPLTLREIGPRKEGRK